MKGRLTTLSCLLLLTVVFLTLSGIATAEVLHKWFEPNPYDSYRYGDTDEDLFYTYTTKDASRSESGGSWSLTASASASANAQAPLSRGQDWSVEFDVDAQLRATGDWDTLTPDPADSLAEMEAGVDKPLTSSDGTTTANTKRVVHIVFYRSNKDGNDSQKFLNASTSGGKSETSVSPTDLDADPWAKAWLEVRRRINLNEPVIGSPFTSETPDCTSSGTGHTCEGYVPPETDVGHCEREGACLTPETSVRNRPRAHIIDCAERTYNQNSILLFLNIKIEEDCKGEKWSCHSNPDNCSRSHLHLKPASEALENEQVINGYVVPAGYSVGACGEHLYPSSGSASSHAEKTGACGHTYYACLQGDHDKLQASCAIDSNCIATSFYLCQHETHTYPAPSVGDTCIGCGDTIASVSALSWHIQKTCDTRASGCGGLYWYCDREEYTFHRTAVQCPAGHHYRECQGHTCASIPPPSSTSNTPPPSSSESGDSGSSNTNSNPSNNNGNTNTNSNPSSPNTGNHDNSDSDDQNAPSAPSAPVVSYHPCSVHLSTDSGIHTLQASCSQDSNCIAWGFYYCQHTSHTYPAPAPVVSYHPCSVHPSTASGVHTLQASCSQDSNCIAWGFYYCQHTTHTYPAVSLRPCGHPTTAIGSHSWVTNCAYYNSDGDRCTNSSGYYRCTPHTHTYPDRSTPTVVCPANSWTNCGGTTSHAATCTAGDSYYTCGTANAWHQDRTCTRCSQTYQNCQNSATACQGSRWHTETQQPTLVACGAASWTGCASQLPSSTAHQVTCTGGHSYWTCGTANAWHQDRTCTRCTQTYQNCGNSATACQGSRWHQTN